MAKKTTAKPVPKKPAVKLSGSHKMPNGMMMSNKQMQPMMKKGK